MVNGLLTGHCEIKVYLFRMRVPLSLTCAIIMLNYVELLKHIPRTCKQIIPFWEHIKCLLHIYISIFTQELLIRSILNCWIRNRSFLKKIEFFWILNFWNYFYLELNTLSILKTGEEVMSFWEQIKFLLHIYPRVIKLLA